MTTCIQCGKSLAGGAVGGLLCLDCAQKRNDAQMATVRRSPNCIGCLSFPYLLCAVCAAHNGQLELGELKDGNTKTTRSRIHRAR